MRVPTITSLNPAISRFSALVFGRNFGESSSKTKTATFVSNCCRKSWKSASRTPPENLPRHALSSSKNWSGRTANWKRSVIRFHTTSAPRFAASTDSADCCLRTVKASSMAKARNYLRRVCESAQRMGELIDDLLLLSRVARAELKRERVDLAGIASVVFEELRKKDLNRNVELRVAEQLFVEADGRLLRVAFDNLLGNAWKFTTKVSEAWIEIGAEQKSGGPVFFVRDNGAGFDMSYAENLFPPLPEVALGIGISRDGDRSGDSAPHHRSPRWPHLGGGCS